MMLRKFTQIALLSLIELLYVTQLAQPIYGTIRYGMADSYNKRGENYHEFPMATNLQVTEKLLVK